MTYEELKIKLDLYDPIDILLSIGKQWSDYWFVVCDEGDCHLFKEDGTEDDIRKVDRIVHGMIPSDIKKIIIPDSVTSIGFSVFENYRKLTSVTIPNSVTSIECFAFGCCRSLTNVSIPDSVTYIEGHTFSYCSSLTSVIIPDSVTNIGYSAFYGCSRLTNVTIPASVTHIGFWAFGYCSKLKSLVFKGKTMDEVKAMKNYPFELIDKSIIKCC